MRPDGSLRVAYWLGDDGAEGELTLDAGWLAAKRKVDDLRSIRDDNLNDAKARLAAWLMPAEGPNASAPNLCPAPAWLLEATATLASWRSAGRLAAVAIRWRRERDEMQQPAERRRVSDTTVRSDTTEAFDALEAWRRRDKHLLEYEANLRDQLQRRRADLYRVFAATMRRRYRAIYVESLDLRTFHELPDPEEPASDPALKEHVRDACLSTLLGAIRETGAAVAVPAPHTTADCASCGSRERLDGAALSHRCSRCSDVWDQDRNAARNLLRAVSTTSAVAVT